MEDFKHAQKGLDTMFEKLKYDRRTGENRSERRQREKMERRTKGKQTKQPETTNG